MRDNGKRSKRRFAAFCLLLLFPSVFFLSCCRSITFTLKLFSCPLWPHTKGWIVARKAVCARLRGHYLQRCFFLLTQWVWLNVKATSILRGLLRMIVE